MVRRGRSEGWSRRAGGRRRWARGGSICTGWPERGYRTVSWNKSVWKNFVKELYRIMLQKWSLVWTFLPQRGLAREIKSNLWLCLCNAVSMWKQHQLHENTHVLLGKNDCWKIDLFQFPEKNIGKLGNPNFCVSSIWSSIAICTESWSKLITMLPKSSS